MLLRSGRVIKLSKMDVLAEEVADFIDENPADASLPISTLESNVKRIEDLRLQIRIAAKQPGNEKLSVAGDRS